MIEISLNVDKADIAAFKWEMMRLQTALHMTPEDASRVGTIAALKSLAASTTKSKPRRKVTQERITVINFAKKTSKLVKVRESFVTEKWLKDGTVQRVEIFAKSLAEAKQSPLAQIKYAGAARASWGWAQQRLFGNGGNANVRKPTRPFMTATASGKGQEYGIDIDNTLDYITRAMQGGRGPAVATALGRASRAMKGRIDQRLKGHLK